MNQTLNPNQPNDKPAHTKNQPRTYLQQQPNATKST